MTVTSAIASTSRQGASVLQLDLHRDMAAAAVLEVDLYARALSQTLEAAQPIIVVGAIGDLEGDARAATVRFTATMILFSSPAR